MRLLVGTFVVLVAVVAAASAVLLVYPSTGEPGQVDAIVKLAGEDVRHEVAVELADAGNAPVLVLSIGPVSLCRGGLPYEVICFRPEPLTTRGEAAAVGGLADTYGWESIAVVTSSYHVTRAERTVRRCTAAEIRMVDAGTDSWIGRAWFAAAREVAALALAPVMRPDC